MVATLAVNTAAVSAQTTQDAKMLTMEEGVAIALAAQPGTVAEAERDQFEGRAVADIDVVNETGEEIEFKVDLETGEILNVWTDDDPTDDPAGALLADATFLIAGDLNGGWDTDARAIGAVLTAGRVAEDLTFENRAGENGAVGLTYMLENAEALPNTLFLNTTQIVARSLNGTTSDSYAELAPVAAPIGDYAAFIVHPGSDLASMADLVSAFTANPGQGAIGGGSAPLGMDHLISAMALGAAGQASDFGYVQFDAPQPAFAALMADEVSALTTEFRQALALAEQGVARILGVTAPADTALPEGVTGLHAQDIAFDFVTWTGFFAAPGASSDEIEVYNDAFAALYQTDAWAQTVAANGWIATEIDAARVEELIQEQHEQISAALRDLGAP